jgi:hypothetical protein
MVCLVGESLIIDTDHWRHFHLLTGIIWGLGIATAKFRHDSKAVGESPEAALPVARPAFGPYSPRPFGA